MVAHGGIGTYIRTVVPRVVGLRRDWTFSVLGKASELEPMLSATRAHLIECRAPIYGIREQVELAQLIPRETTVFWAPHYNIPLFRRVSMVVTIHDLAHLRLREYAGFARRLYARALFHSVRRRASAVMFDSEFSRGEFFELVGTPRGLAETVHIGLPPELLESGIQSQGPPLESPYYVYLGNAKPHKNLGALLDAFVQLRAELDARLVIIGQTGNLRTTDATTLARFRVTDGVSVLGEVTPNVLRRFVTHATALVLPSLYEGFGLPPLEAMALGCPAIVARAASLPEICGDAAAYFDPANSRELAGLMRRLAIDRTLRETMIARGRAWVRQFDADRTAVRVQEIIEASARLKRS